MSYLILLAVLASGYFVEWIPNNAAEPPAPPPGGGSPGEFPWQL